MKKYDQYKNSGVEWLGEIPKHWEVLPGLGFIYENKDRNKGMIRNTVLSLSYGKIRIKGENELTGLVPESFETYQFVNKGDLIFRPTDLQNDTVSLRSSISEFEGIITNAYLNLRFKSIANPKFYHYLFRSIDNNKVIYGLGSGLRQNISYLDFRRFPFPFPPINEQTAIANFLDDKTAKIDQAIAIKQKQIELLKERRQILIHKAVTRGLDENVKLKDSGVEWIGEIPEHWDLKNLKFLKANIKNAFVDGPFGSNLKSEHFIENGDVFVVESGFITTGVFINKTFKTISEKHYQTIKRSTCNVGDIIIAKIGANYGMAAELPELDKKAVVSGNSLKITLDKKKVQNILFVKLLGLSKQLGGFEEIVNASAQPALSLGGLNNLKLPIAPIQEQKQISDYVIKVELKIATAISLKEREIEKLKEYKMSLIDGVVTGKVRVI